MSDAKNEGGGGYLPFEFWGVRLRSSSTDKPAKEQRVKKDALPDSPLAKRKGTDEKEGGSNAQGNSSPDPVRRGFRFGRRKTDDAIIDKKTKAEKEDREHNKEKNEERETAEQGENKAASSEKKRGSGHDKDKEKECRNKERDMEDAARDKDKKRDRDEQKAKEREKRRDNQRTEKRNSREHEKSKGTDGDDRRKERRLVSALSSNALSSYKNYIKDDMKDTKKRSDHIRNTSGNSLFPCV